MNAAELKQRFPEASPAFIRLNATSEGSAIDIPAGHSGEAAELERHPGNGAVGTLPVQKPTSGRFLVRVTSRRKRLLDFDNLCEKYHVDCCRYAGVIPGDGPSKTLIEVCEEKVEPGAEEETIVEIYQLQG